MNKVDVFVLYDDVQYDKQGWRNRNRIKNAQGAQWLTVPVLTKGKKKQLINQTRINHTAKWNTKHLKSLQSSYINADYFDELFPEMELLLKKKWDYILDLDLSFIFLLKEYLGIKSKVVLSSSLKKKIPVSASPELRLIEICERVGGGTLYEGEAGQGYIDHEIFEKAGVDLVYQKYPHPVYKQLYGDFISHLSVVDLMFNEGPNSLAILELNQI